jgi:hypothetical protein
MHTDENSQEDQFRKRLAKWLGISFDDLEEYAEEVEPNNGNIDRSKFGYYLQFSDSTPPEVTNKLKRLDSNNILYFNLEEIDARF